MRKRVDYGVNWETYPRVRSLVLTEQKNEDGTLYNTEKGMV